MSVFVVEGKDNNEENGGSFCVGVKFWSEGEKKTPDWHQGACYLVNLVAFFFRTRNILNNIVCHIGGILDPLQGDGVPYSKAQWQGA